MFFQRANCKIFNAVSGNQSGAQFCWQRSEDRRLQLLNLSARGHTIAIQPAKDLLFVVVPCCIVNAAVGMFDLRQ